MELLRRHGHEVEVAATEAAAVARPPDLIVLDARTAGEDGLRILERLRAAPSSQGLPVILLTDRAGAQAALEGRDGGADDCLVEPVSGASLLVRVRAGLAFARARREDSARLAEAAQELAAFSYCVSHDLRAPLRAIDGFSQALLTDHAGQLNAEGRRYLERVRSATQRMAQLIDDLIGLTRITRSPFHRGPLDLTGIARRTLAALAERDSHRLPATEVAEHLHAEGDARLVQLLFETLLDNAWKFTSRKPAARIEVGSEHRGGEQIFYVRDDGEGFDMRYADKLFSPFQRLHSAKDFPGTGIGLATAQRIVHRHGGRIWAEAATGKGATFFFTLAEGA